MRNMAIILCLFFLSGCNIPEEEAYLFSYFTGNGNDGLHLAYSIDGMKWEALKEGESFLKPIIGKDSLMRDPCIIKGPEGNFHMVWTTGWWDKTIGYAWSEDLVNWSKQKAIPVMEHEPEAKNSWAPEIFYDKKTENFSIFWATTIPGRHSDVAESEREKGLNHRMYSTSTKDFVRFEPTELFFNPDFSVIDATIIENKEEFFMFIKNENPNPPEKNIRYTKSSSPAGPFPIEVSEPITGDYWAEGPTTLKVDGYYYVYFDKYREHRYGAVRSADLMQWEDISDSISFPMGTRHGSAFTVSMEFLEHLKTTLK